MNDKQTSDTSAESLAQRLAQKNAELEAAQKGLECISYTISHDLRAPLRTIDSFSQALVDDYGGQLPEEAAQHVARIRKATTHMRGMIEQLLELARVGRRKLEIQDINLSQLAREIIEELTQQDPGRAIEFVIDDGLHTRGDKALLKTALQHLLHNAWKFTQQQEPARIEFTQTKQDGNTVFAVKDNGIGFDTSYYDQLFDPFKRLHSEKEYGGMGVGLSIAQQIIERHNGKIWAESEPNQGASFYFYLGKEYQI